MAEIKDIDKDAQCYTTYLIKIMQKQVTSEAESETIAEIISDMENFQNFNNGLTELLIEHGYNGDREDSVSKANYLYSKIQETGIPTEDFFTKESVRNWFQEKNIPWKDSNRIKMMAICFALHLSVEQTETFFRKIFLGQPFNFRNSTECILYYCLHNEKSYADAKRLESELQNMRNKTNLQETSSATRIIRDSLSTFGKDDESELLKYLLQNVPVSETYYNTAKRYIEKLTQRAINFSLLSKNKNYEQNRKDTLENPDTDLQKQKIYKGINCLMQEIYGFSTESSHKKEKYVFKDGLSKTLTRNFPKQHELGRILKGDNTVSSDMVRRTLIVLKFYTNYFYANLKKMSFREFNFKRFVSETNGLMNECGFQELYIRHPFDFIFYYCALCAENDEKEPDFGYSLNVFRDIMGELHEISEPDKN